MIADSVLFGVICFAVGIALQAFLMLRGSIRRGDDKRAAKALGMSLAGMFGGNPKHEYLLLGHILLSLTLFGTLFAYAFRERLLPRVGARLLLAWNIVFVYVLVRAGWGSPATLTLIAVPSVLTVANTFSDMDRDFRWKVFFHTWFSIILVVIAIRGFNAGPLAMFLGDAAPEVAPPPLEMLAEGAAYLYIVTNAWFVLALIPLPSRGQRWEERENEIRAHMELLARGYAWEKDDAGRSLAVLVALPLVLIGAARWGGGNERTIGALAIALMPWLGERAEARVQRGKA